MNFKSKNYRYSTIPFGEFIDRAERGERLYLRTLSTEKPSEIPADINNDFPSIASDFQLPPELNVIAQRFHSSPLRIGGEVNMWLHYDASTVSTSSCLITNLLRGYGQCALSD